MFDRIRDMSEDKDMTQAQMAEFLKVHQTTYSDYELGNLNIPIPLLDKTADLLETSIDYLVNRTDERSSIHARSRYSIPRLIAKNPQEKPAKNAHSAFILA